MGGTICHLLTIIILYSNNTTSSYKHTQIETIKLPGFPEDTGSPSIPGSVGVVHGGLVGDGWVFGVLPIDGICVFLII